MKRASFLSAAAASLVLWPTRAEPSMLDDLVASEARRFPGTIGVYARTLAPKPPAIAFRATREFPTASVIKLLIMAAAYVAEEIEPGSLERRIVFDRSRQLIGGSDFMAGQPNGTQFTVKQLVVPMIDLSDNTAANMLIGHFGVRRINALGERVGMTRTRLARKFLDFGAIGHNDNISTPADMGRLLYVIERGAHEGISTIVSSPHCRAMVRIMLGQTDRNKIPAALPRGTPIANKTGELTGTLNDVAIVDPFGNGPWILTIMTERIDDYAAAYAAIHRIARAAYASV